MEQTNNIEQQLLSLCESAHLARAKQLYHTHKHAIRNVNDFRRRAFKIACANGHLLVAQWLYSDVHPTRLFHFIKHTPTLDTDLAQQAFDDALRNKHLQLAEWIYTVKPTIDISKLIENTLSRLGHKETSPAV